MTTICMDLHPLSTTYKPSLPPCDPECPTEFCLWHRCRKLERLCNWLGRYVLCSVLSVESS